VKMICKEDAKIGVLSKWRNDMWNNLKDLDEQEIDFCKEQWYSKIFDIKAPGLCSIYSVKKSGKGKKIKVESSARYLPLNENYEIYDPLEGVNGATYKRGLIRLLWRCLIYNTEGCKKFDPEWYAGVSQSRALQGCLFLVPLHFNKFFYFYIVCNGRAVGECVS